MTAFLQSEVEHNTLQSAADSLRAATGSGAAHAGEQGGSIDFGELIHHVQDSHELDLPFIGHVELPHFAPVHLAGLTIDLSITKHVVFLWVAVALLRPPLAAALAQRGLPGLLGGMPTGAK